MLHYRRAIVIRSPIERVFAFHLDTHNAARIAPPFPRVTVVRATTPPTAGQTVQSLRVGLGLGSLLWDALVTRVEPPTLIEDTQQQGPFAHWIHEHRFEAIDAATTRMTDIVTCALPVWLGGALVENTAVRLQLSLMFASRQARTKRLLEDAAEPVWLTPSHEIDQVAARALGVDSTGRTRQTGFFPAVTVPPKG